ncbi:MAG TPA: PilZ domain-containing protein [Terriglobales bacterium]|nr:PilZ domain-containing protein [Terriglobales bacterium]
MSRLPSHDQPTERRERQRYPLRLMLDVHCVQQNALKAVSRDASEIGISFFCDQAIPPGAQIEFDVHVPEGLVEEVRVFVRGKGKVIRSEQRPQGHYLVAVKAFGFKFMRVAGSANAGTD